MREKKWFLEKRKDLFFCLKENLRLEIVISGYFECLDSTNLFYFLFNEFNYLFNYLNISVKNEKIDHQILTKKELNRYLFLIINSPFLWKKEDLSFLDQSKICEESNLYKNSLYILSEDKKINNSIEKLQNILHEISPFKNLRIFLLKKNNVIKKKSENNKNTFSYSSKWEKRRIFDLGIHTNYSSLDGIGTPEEYIKSAIEKNYSAIAFTDHYNIQSFPRVNQIVKKENFLLNNIKIIYGCEVEMIEDKKTPTYLFNIDDVSKEILKNKKIKEFRYCFFDIETSGFFSEFNQVIEIGYTIFENGKIIASDAHLTKVENISKENWISWYTNITKQELENAEKIGFVLEKLRKEWEGCLMVAHNAARFDFNFLNKVWKKHFGEDLKFTFVDTLFLSRLAFKQRRSYSLEKLTQYGSKEKKVQIHRALEDSKLLLELFKKILKYFEENEIIYWKDLRKITQDEFFYERGKNVKLLVKNSQGLQDLYSLITLSHTKRLFKNPTLFRSDIIKFRKNLLVGASGGVNGEIFDIFSTFKTETEREKKISFFDYVELYNPDSLKHLWLNGSIEETKFQKTIKKIIDKARKCSVPVIASNNVHYTKKEEEVLKRILVAHKSNGSSHSLYSDATWNSKANRFFILPQQHLLSLAEILEKWSFLSEEELLEELIFSNHEKLLRDIEDISIDSLKIDYSKDEGLAEKKEELVKAYKNKADYLFGKNWPSFVHSRIKKEWEIIEKKYTFVYWLTYKIAQKAQKENFIIGSRGSVGSSFLAFLCGITDLNPLPFYKYCKICRHCEIYEADSRDFSCYDYREKELCGSCLESGLNSYLSIEGHNLPQSTFFGLDGKKTPDIDLNFSGEKQKEVHTLIMKMLGEKRAVRAGTISTVSQQTAEIIYSSYRKLTQSLDSRKLKETNLENSSNEWQQKYWKDLLQKNYSFEKIESSWDPSHSDEIIDALNEKFKELEFLKKELEREKNESLEN